MMSSKIGVEADGIDGSAIEDGFEDQSAGVAAEWKRARRHFVEDDAEGKEVAAGIDFFAAHLFGRHVGDGAESGAGAGEVLVARTLRCGGVGDGFTAGGDGVGHFCEAEVENFCGATFGDEDIGGLDVAVNDAGAVSGVERVGDFDADFEKAIEFERAAGDDVLESRTVEKLHGDEGAAVVFADVVDGADVGMIQRGSGASFALEAIERLRVASEIIGKKLESDEAAETRVFCFVNHAHATAAEFFDDAVVGNRLTDEGRRIGHWMGEILWGAKGCVK